MTISLNPSTPPLSENLINDMLPTEIILLIFKHLENIDDINAAMCTCKLWNTRIKASLNNFALKLFNKFPYQTMSHAHMWSSSFQGNFTANYKTSIDFLMYSISSPTLQKSSESGIAVMANEVSSLSELHIKDTVHAILKQRKASLDATHMLKSIQV